MEPDDARRVVQCLDEALRIFRQYEGRLTTSHVRARSMLSVVRAELTTGFPIRLPEDGKLFGESSPVETEPTTPNAGQTARPWATRSERSPGGPPA